MAFTLKVDCLAITKIFVQLSVYTYYGYSYVFIIPYNIMYLADACLLSHSYAIKKFIMKVQCDFCTEHDYTSMDIYVATYIKYIMNRN